MSAVSTEPTQASVTVRRSGRISKEIPIILSGGDAAGRQFSERTRTLLLSLHGASVICHHKLIPEQEAYLRVISKNREAEVRICGQIGERDDGYIYGVAFADADIDFWRIEFPPAEALPNDLTPVTLECSGCRRQAALQFDATEMDVYVVNEGMLRYCSQCSLSTVWKIATPKAEQGRPMGTPAGPRIPTGLSAENAPAATSHTEIRLAVDPAPTPSAGMKAASVPAAPIPPPIKPSVSPAQPNRRRDRRTKVKFNACIRISGGDEEIVPCEDMSRGGFSFRSERQYSVETTIEAAIPYEPGMSIFVPAQIANVFELQGGKVFRYGVAYTRSPKT
ncbi:MAG TPA: PilZ domain-containing protein [Candidatus Acidoferrales bacterium]|nr:PilZ domain-containing protein [Candidatus Acidoferrales bacterium]